MWEDPKDYFETVVWPMYLKYNEKPLLNINGKEGGIEGLFTIDSEKYSIQSMVEQAMHYILLNSRGRFGAGMN
jgi:hypothetical protein